MAKLSIPKIDMPPLQVPQTTGEWKRTILWMIWTLNLLLNLVYIILTFITSSKMANVGGTAFCAMMTASSPD